MVDHPAMCSGRAAASSEGACGEFPFLVFGDDDLSCGVFFGECELDDMLLVWWDEGRALVCLLDDVETFLDGLAELVFALCDGIDSIGRDLSDGCPLIFIGEDAGHA